MANAAVLVAVFVLLLITPVTVSAPIRLTEALVLAAGLAVSLGSSVVLIRRALSPLRSLAEQMQGIDLRSPRPLAAKGAALELASFLDAFNTMIDRLTEERRAGARAALTAQERERLRVGRALHDEAGQSLTAIALEIERLAKEGPPGHRAQLTALAAQLHESLDDIRRISRELRPEALDDLGLINALIALTSRVGRQGRIRIDRELSNELPPLSEELELVIYRVAQEALTNVLRHAEASRCRVGLTMRGREIELRVEDDGLGMGSHAEHETIGIEGMRERALLVGGELTIHSPQAAGTHVLLRVPSDGGA